MTARVGAVAFARGVERNVFFAMEGRPAAEPGSETPSAAAVVRAVPVVLLADQGTRLNSGEAYIRSCNTGICSTDVS